MAGRIAAIAAAALALVCIGACTLDLCARNTDCETGLVCSAYGNCVVPPPPCNSSADSDAGTDGGGCTSDAAVDAGDDAAIDAAIDAGIDATTDASTVAVACPAAVLPCWPALTRASAAGADRP